MSQAYRYNPIPKNDCGSTWCIVLAGGEGERMQPLIQSWLNERRPKQFCAFTGTRSMLDHTLDRLHEISPPRRVVTVIGPRHLRYLQHNRGGDQRTRILQQPEARGTGLGVYTALACIMRNDPESTILLLPSDHFMYPEQRFGQEALRAVGIDRRNPDKLVLVGARPQFPEPEYGWIEPGARKHGSGSASVRRVESFREKPSAAKAERFYRLGWLCNTMIVAAQARALWTAGVKAQPKMLRRLSAIARWSPGPLALRALRATYGETESVDFSRDILQKCTAMSLACPLRGMEWNDWGRPERIERSLASIGKRPNFHRNLALAQPGP
ncbi:MAG TPA: sugar phosphate nucleotidyltransferase [Acidobacteriota bacterium]|nr:sugar phosphate nucleotidyltransferase [Acidobacteriota bacterium]